MIYRLKLAHSNSVVGCLIQTLTLKAMVLPTGASAYFQRVDGLGIGAAGIVMVH